MQAWRRRLPGTDRHEGWVAATAAVMITSASSARRSSRLRQTPLARVQPSAVRDQVGHVIVQCGHRLVERGEPGTAGPGELGQVSAGDLTVADDPLNGNVRVPGIVGPEFVPRVAGDPSQNCLRGGGRWPSRMSRRMRLPWVIGQVAKFPLVPANQFSAATW